MEQGLQYYIQLLQSCNTHGLVHHGKQLHLLFIKKGIFNSLLTVGNRLVQMYARCGSMGDAQKLFDEMPHRNCFTWNTLIEGYMRSGHKEKSLEVFHSMPEKNEFSWNVVISGCSKMGDLSSARCLFNHMPKKNGIAWNSIIHGLLSHGLPKDALKMFKLLSFNPDEVSSGKDGHVLASIIGACTDLMALNCGKQIHARILVDNVDFDSVLASSLVNMYCKCGDLDNAARVLNIMKNLDAFSVSALISGYSNAGRIDNATRIFEKSDYPCVVIWNSMISGYVYNNNEQEALTLFSTMRRRGIFEDFSTLSSVLSACSNTGNLRHGNQLHALVVKLGDLKDAIVGCSLIDMYSKCKSPIDACKLFSELDTRDTDTVLLNSMISLYSNCGRVEDAKNIFDTIQHKTVISWNSMIVGLSQNGLPMAALDLFRNMNNKDVIMDKFTLASVISACASISCVLRGEQCFGRAVIIGVDTNPIVCTSLIDLYCKCGFVVLGRRLFDSMNTPDLVTWNSMLVGYAANGYGNEVLGLFKEMREANEISLMAVLSGCGHCGMVREAREVFGSMEGMFGVKPGFEHYCCMVDVYARGGYLEEAMEVIEMMEYEADVGMWLCVLRGCLSHGKRGLGKTVAGIVIELDDGNSAAYVQLSGLLAGLEDWEGLERVRAKMKEKNVHKNPGLSWG